MTLWLVLTVMITASAVCLTVPLVRRFDQRRNAATGAIEVYRDQLQGVERELREGAIDVTQAQTAQVEIKRRMLTLDRSSGAALPPLSAHERNFAVICATGIVVLGSVGLYALTGRPDLGSSSASLADGRGGSLAMLSSPPPGHPVDPVEALAAATEAPSGDEWASSQAGLPSVEEMTRRLAARLSQHPDDIEGWRTLGWSYLNVGRFSEAAGAYAKAIKLDPGNAELKAGRIEALMDAANGAVTTEVKAAITEAVRLDPRNARVQFFEGLAKAQDGDKAAALTEWTELLKDADPQDGWVADLRTRVSELRHDLGIEGGTVSEAPTSAIVGLAPKDAAAQATTPTAEKGPSAEEVRAADAMSPNERSAMIRGMVDGLASRLERSPDDADGWIRLLRARIVLGERDLANRALARSLEVFAGDPAERDRIAASARQLGLAP